MKQLALPIQLDQRATFENYIPGRNSTVVQQLQSLPGSDDELQIYLWSNTANGKSHLLQSLCMQAVQQGSQMMYLPLSLLASADADIFENLEQFPLVCLDDIDSICSDPIWAERLFHLINRLRNAGSKLAMTADQPPASLQIPLKDLKSRLGWGPVYQLKPLTDDDLEQFLIQRASGQGLTFPAEVVTYLIRHTQRDLAAMIKLVDKIDQEALAQQRRVTVPFVRSVLPSEGSDRPEK